MQIISGSEELQHLKQAVPSATAIGKFDGLHLGHQQLLKRLNVQKELGMTSVILTFDPAPAVYFGYSDPKELLVKEEKRSLFAEMGCDLLIEFPFNQQTAAISPEAFIKDFLIEKINTRYICAGSDLSFGDKGSGNVRLLQTLSGEYGYRAEIIDKVSFHGQEVSSTYIKEELKKGNLAAVNTLLGRKYSLRGVVVSGNRIGRTIGMPTANFFPAGDKLLPPLGVYISQVQIVDDTTTTTAENGISYPAITNIGYKPTVAAKPVLGVETHLLEFNGDLYDREIHVELLHFQRTEQKFPNLEALKTQLKQDISAGRQFFGNSSAYNYI